MKIKQITKWFFYSMVHALLAWLAVNGNNGAGNLFIFLSWLFALMYVLASVFIKQIDWGTIPQRFVPPIVSGMFQLSIIFYLVWYGWWWTSIAWTIKWIFMESVYQTFDKMRKENENI